MSLHEEVTAQTTHKESYPNSLTYTETLQSIYSARLLDNSLIKNQLVVS